MIILLFYTLAACFAVAHLIWVFRQYSRLLYLPFSEGHAPQEAHTHLQNLGRRTRLDLVLAFVMLFTIACINAFAAFMPLPDCAPCSVLRVCFGHGIHDAGIMTLGVFGIYWGVICVLSFWVGARVRHQVGAIWFFRKELGVEKLFPNMACTSDVSKHVWYVYILIAVIIAILSVAFYVFYL